MRIGSNLFLILLSGMAPEEVQRFFREARNKLILAKEKAQNLPRSHDKALIFISKFQDAAKHVLFQWILENIIPKETIEDEKILEYVQSALDEYSETKDSEMLVEVYRQILFRLARLGEDDPINSQIIEHCKNVMLEV